MGACEPHDQPPAGACIPSVEPYATLGSIDGEGLFTSVALSVSALSDGRFLVYDWNETATTGGSLKAFDSDGSFIGLIGGRGQGPGEFVRPHPAVLTHGGERLAVFDRALARLTYLSPDGAEVISTHPLPPFTSIAYVAVLPDDRFVATGRLFSDPRALGQPLHLLDAQGSLVRSFGADPPIQGDLDSRDFQRRTTLSKDGTILGAMLTEYRVERWDTAGTKAARDIVREVDWFTPQDELRPYGRSRSEPPNPRLQTIWEDDEGRVWVFSQVPADDWWERASPREHVSGETRYYARERPAVLFDTHIDVWDPSFSEVIYEGRVPMGLWGAYHGLIMRSTTDDDGLVPQIDVMQLILQCPDESDGGRSHDAEAEG
jgi:hypothetical protein